MIGLERPRSAGPARGDDGIALVVAIALIGIVGMLIASIVAVAMYESRASGRDRQRSQGVAAAEQVVDTLMAQIQGTALTAVPCGEQTTNVAVASDRLDVVSTVTYYDEAGAEITDCSAVRSGSLQAHQAFVEATATSEAIAQQAAAERHVETLVNLEPAYGNALTKAIFGDDGVRFSNNSDIYGEDGQPNADIYTNGNFQCNNSLHIHGSLFARGSVSMANSCIVEVDLHAGTGFAGNNPGVTINGRLMVANGNAHLDKNMHVGQQVLVSGVITSGVTTGVCAVPNKCFQGAAVPPVPQQDFPIINGDSGTINEWVSAGYTNVVRFGSGGLSCTGTIPNPWNGKADWIGYWLFLNGTTLPSDTIIVSTCNQPVLFQGIDITLNKNLAIFSNAGVTFSNNTRVSSHDGGQRNLYLIQPADTPKACSGSGISLDNQVTVDPTVDVLMYSPCDVRKANNTTHYGQIYSGGTANIDNKLVMHYRPLPVFGVQGSDTIESYSLEVQFKRENV